jgi:hypothetical protein
MPILTDEQQKTGKRPSGRFLGFCLLGAVLVLILAPMAHPAALQIGGRVYLVAAGSGDWPSACNQGFFRIDDFAYYGPDGIAGVRIGRWMYRVMWESVER